MLEATPPSLVLAEVVLLAAVSVSRSPGEVETPYHVDLLFNVIYSNVIFRNLVLYKSLAPVDLIGLQVATNVWVSPDLSYNQPSNSSIYIPF